MIGNFRYKVQKQNCMVNYCAQSNSRDQLLGIKHQGSHCLELSFGDSLKFGNVGKQSVKDLSVKTKSLTCFSEHWYPDQTKASQEQFDPML
jgi:hypothetical protein